MMMEHTQQIFLWLSFLTLRNRYEGKIDSIEDSIIDYISHEKITISILSDMDRPHPENKDVIEMALQL